MSEYSRLLISEPPLTVLPSLAVLIGLNEAIALQQVNYWLTVVERDPSKAASHFRDGRWWVYNTYEDWRSGNFPFWSLPTIRRTFSSLEKKGLLVSAQYDKKHGNCKKWYAIDGAALRALSHPSDQNDHTPSDHPLDPSDQNDHTLGSKRSHPPINLISSYIDSETTSENSTENNPPLTPQGGNRERLSNDLERSETGSEQTPTANKKAKKSGGSKNKKRSAARKTQTAEDVLADLPPEMRERFDKFWGGYSTFCTQRGAKAGAKKPAAVAWAQMVRKDFNGKGLEAFDRGVHLFVRQQGDSTSGIPHAGRFIFSAKNGSGAWEDAIAQAESSGQAGEFGVGEPRRADSQVHVAPNPAEREAYKPIPPNIKAKIEALRTSPRSREAV